MIKFKKFLVPTDFSRYSRNALECAIALARKCDSKLFLLHVLDTNQFPPDLVLHHLALEPGRMEKALEAEAEKNLKSLITRVKRARIQYKTLVKKGNPHAVIAALARSQRQSPCPVLTVKNV